MQRPKALVALLISITRHLQARRRVQMYLLFGLSVVASLAESVAVGAVTPFLAILTAPQAVLDHPGAKYLIQALGVDTTAQLLLPITLAFAGATAVTGVMRLLVLWSTTHWSHCAGAELCLDAYRRTLYQPYTVHIERNSSELLAGISGKVGRLTYTLLQLQNLISSVIIVTGILATLILVNPTIAFGAFVGFGLIYTSIIFAVRPSLSRSSEVVAREAGRIFKALQEGLGGIRDILLDGTQEYYCRQFGEAETTSRRAQASNSFLSMAPRHAVEMCSMLLIAFLAYLMTDESSGLQKAVPILGAIALGAQRILPALQMAYSAWVTLQGDKATIIDALSLLDQSLPDPEDLKKSSPSHSRGLLS